MTPRVLFYVQHLLGIGHLVRVGRLAQALAAAGFEVDIVMGGEAVPVFATSGMRVLQLPPVRAGPEGFSALLDQAGKPVDEAFWTERRARLLAAFDSARPDILIIEAFPFGRRQMRPELLPLLAAAHGRPDRPLVVCSIRDILQESTKPDRAEETVAVLREFFDLVLVHGDPSFVRLDATFRLAHEIASLIRYTGMIGPPPAAPAQDRFDVVVSAGGGAVGLRLLRAALEARPATRLAKARWCLVTGPNLDRAAAMELERAAPPGVSIERFRSDLPTLLAGARLSISQAGYNTAADVLSARCRAVMVPFAAGGETEQSRRARLLAARGLASVAEEADLDAERLATAIETAMDRPAPPPEAWPDLGGGPNTARLLRESLAARCFAKRDG